MPVFAIILGSFGKSDVRGDLFSVLACILLVPKQEKKNQSPAATMKAELEVLNANSHSYFTGLNWFL